MGKMPADNPFAVYTGEYEDWFEKYPMVFKAELKAVKSLLPAGSALEVGVGSGRFAVPLQVAAGIDPCPEMLTLARGRGVRTALGRAEALPLSTACFDCLLLITVLCFLPEPERALSEARRVLRPGGHLVLAFIDRHSPLGREMNRHREKSNFYRRAHFYSIDEVLVLLKGAGFKDFSCCQTVFRPLAAIDAGEEVRTGCGEGTFVVVRARAAVGNGL
ncbi:Methyltransferase TM1293 [hydrothermal vent metagenome]|uniref:Methyltransferase TM1293 n=1 Tax=hydrothermal vent metagenome TaxID=652676 RepID=A0A3B0UT37_9ZZZZ